MPLYVSRLGVFAGPYTRLGARMTDVQKLPGCGRVPHLSWSSCCTLSCSTCVSLYMYVCEKEYTDVWNSIMKMFARNAKKAKIHLRGDAHIRPHQRNKGAGAGWGVGGWGHVFREQLMREDLRVPGFHYIISLNQIISLVRLSYAGARHHCENSLREHRLSFA